MYKLTLEKELKDGKKIVSGVLIKDQDIHNFKYLNLLLKQMVRAIIKEFHDTKR